MIRLSLIVATFSVALTVLAAPLPPNGAFPYQGFPKFIESGWVEVVNPTNEGHVSIFYNGQAIDQILKKDGNLSTQMMNITSYACLDDNNYRYMANRITYPKKTLETLCFTEYTNATHRLSAVLPPGEQGCPESPFAATGPVDPNSGPPYFTFLRQEGVLPSPSESTCVNQSNPYIPPLYAVTQRNLTKSNIADMPYPRSYGPSVPQGIWKGNQAIFVENKMYYAGARVSVDLNGTDTSPSTATNSTGNLYAFVGQFYSHDCLTPTNFVATSLVTRVFNSGDVDYATACQNGTRTQGPNGVDVLDVQYGRGPNCTIYSIPDPDDSITTQSFTYELVQPLLSNPDTECVYQLDLEPNAQPSSATVTAVVGVVEKSVVTLVLAFLVAAVAVMI